MLSLVRRGVRATLRGGAPSSAGYARRLAGSAGPGGASSSPLRRYVLLPLAIGAAAGGLGSMVGLGGGFIMIPLLTHYCGVSQKQATAASLMAVVGTGTFGAVGYGLSGDVDYLASLGIAGTAMVMSVVGARLTGGFDEKMLKRLFGVLCIVLAPTVPLRSVLLKGRPGSSSLEGGGGSSAPRSWREHLHRSLLYEKPLSLLGTGALTGFISGFFGVGGGGLITPIVCFISDFSQQKVLGTTLLAMVPSAITGSIAHYFLQNLVLPMLPALLVGSSLGSIVGSRIAHKSPESALRILFSIVLAISGLKMLR